MGLRTTPSAAAGGHRHGHNGLVSALHIHRFGPATGPAILALHGLTGHGKRWQALAEQLPDIRIIAPDLRGHGRSTALPPWDFETVVADLVTTVADETDPPVVLLGHSFGGACALHLAHRHPHLVRALVLLDPAIAVDPRLLHDIAAAGMERRGYDSVEQARRDKLETAWGDVEPRLLRAELDEHLIPTADGRFDWRMSPPAVTAYWGQLARDFVLPPADLPTVLVRAVKTSPPFVTPEFRAALAERLGERLTVHEWDCDHMIAQARPTETAALLRAVLRDLP